MPVFQVVDIMRVNVDKVLERDQKISELDDRAGKKFLQLNSCAQLEQFDQSDSLFILVFGTLTTLVVPVSSIGNTCNTCTV